MNSDDLIERLSSEVRRKHAFGATASLLVAVSVGSVVALALSYALLAPIEWSMQRLLEPVFIIKIAFILSLLLASLSIVRDLSSPGRKVSLQLAFALIPFVVLAALSYDEVTARHADSFRHQLMHQSVLSCLWHVGLLALPAFAVLVIAVRALAPVDLMRAGLYTGLLSGSIGSLGYAFHCHDEFITLVWASYSLAIVQMGAIGALLGPRLLRWT